MSPAPTLTERTIDGLRVLTDERAAHAGLAFAFTDRNGGVGSPPYDTLNLGDHVGDDPVCVGANRERLARSLGYDAASLRLARQVHGADVLDADTASSGAEGDVLVTRTVEVPVAVLTADCTPTVIRGDDVLVVAHAGWRGLVGGALEAALSAAGDPSRASAWIGPAIGACCYEVGPEVIAAFARSGLPVADDAHVSPADAAAHILRDGGVSDVAVAGVCTSCDTRYFSHRRDGTTGRQGVVAWLT